MLTYLESSLSKEKDFMWIIIFMKSIIQFFIHSFHVHKLAYDKKNIKEERAIYLIKAVYILNAPR